MDLFLVDGLSSSCHSLPAPSRALASLGYSSDIAIRCVKPTGPILWRQYCVVHAAVSPNWRSLVGLHGVHERDAPVVRNCADNSGAPYRPLRLVAVILRRKIVCLTAKPAGPIGVVCLIVDPIARRCVHTTHPSVPSANTQGG